MNQAEGNEEHQLREELGIPPGARQVMILGESSHWDPNWLLTSEQYYCRHIRHILDAAVQELEKEPRRVFSIEGIFFLRLYFEREPGMRERVRRLIDEGRLRLTGTGITTPDMVLPDTEAIVRDYLLGQQWMREQGFQQEPRLAYLPDGFGSSPETPALLKALGFDMTALSRIDGMYFAGCDYRPRGDFPLRGSSAEVLQERLKSADFVWRAQDGSTVLCHWNPFTYFQGDLLTHLGVVRWMGRAVGIPMRGPGHVARRIEGYAAALRPLARTPYLFCPIGCDFNPPLADLVELLDRYNRRRFPEGGVYAVNAGLDDYLRLVDCHRHRLPVLELDPNPYWMGFYASRPEIKARHNRLVRKLVVAEKLAVLAPTGDEWRNHLKTAWDLVAVANHHDFITGTSPDKTWKDEQEPWLLRAEEETDRALGKIRSRCPSPPAAPDSRPPAWRLANGRLEVATPHYRVQLFEKIGGCLVGFRDAAGTELLTGPANDLVAYQDSGGLWRLGHELRGGTFRERCRSSQSHAGIRVEERDGLLAVQVESDLAYCHFVRRMWFRSDTPVIRMRITGAAAWRRTIACRFPVDLQPVGLTMDVPGGVVTRPVHKIHDPTYWPARSFVHARDSRTGAGLAAFLGGPACLGWRSPSDLEWVVLRNVPREKAYGCLPVPAHPASGTDPDQHEFDYAVCLTGKGDWRDNDLLRLAGRALGSAWLTPRQPDWDRLAESVIETEGSDCLVTAAKPAEDGDGLIVRLFRMTPDSAGVRLHARTGSVRAAWMCDARERNLAELPVRAGAVEVTCDGALTSVRLRIG